MTWMGLEKGILSWELATMLGEGVTGDRLTVSRVQPQTNLREHEGWVNGQRSAERWYRWVSDVLRYVLR